MKKKKSLIIISVFSLLLLILFGVSYAYWYLTKTQTGKNVIETGCLNLSLTNEQNEINLMGTQPLSDEDGAKLTPYTFTVTNTCDNTEYYQVNLETLAETTLNEKYVRVIFDGGEGQDLNTYPTAEKYFETSLSSRTLAVGSLTKNESKNYSLRVFLGGESAIDEDSMNKRFESKIVINGSLNEYNSVATNPTSGVLYGYEDYNGENYFADDYHFFIENGVYTFARKIGDKKSICLYNEGSLKCFDNLTEELLDEIVNEYGPCSQVSGYYTCNVSTEHNTQFTTKKYDTWLFLGVSSDGNSCSLRNSEVSCTYYSEYSDKIMEYRYEIWKGKTIYHNINGSRVNTSENYMDLVNAGYKVFIKENKTANQVCLYNNSELECYDFSDESIANLNAKYTCTIDYRDKYVCEVDENITISYTFENYKDFNIYKSGEENINSCEIYQYGGNFCS